MAKSTTQQILADLAEYEKTAPSYALELRLSFGELIMDQLTKREWTQRRLAEAAGFRESYVSRVLSGDANFTTESAARLLHALGIRAEVIEQEELRQLKSSRSQGITTQTHTRTLNGKESYTTTAGARGEKVAGSAWFPEKVRQTIRYSKKA